ncbi:zinc ribbon domain-containing protein, partial [bacterium]|nr:zinc ribbon domain-containing protein [bacterium]
MKCRKCGAEIPDNSLRCPNCSIRVNVHCPECRALVPFGEKKCPECGFEIIKTCPECSSLNIYAAKECRKCHYNFETKQSEEQEDAVVGELEEENKPDEIQIIQDDGEVQLAEEPENTENIENVEENDVSGNEEESDLSVIVDMETIGDNTSDLVIDNIKENSSESDEKIEILEDIEPEELVEEVVEEDEPQPQPSLEKEIIIQSEVTNKIIDLIKTSIDKHIIAINGIEGSGKTAVLKQVENNLKDENYIFLYGSCTPLIQITSFGFFQDAFLRIMGFPPYTKSVENFVKEFRSSDYAEMFSFLTPQELKLFLNIFYPSLTDEFENIEINKNEIFLILEKVIKSFSLNSNLVIAIDNFELLDGASYDFIVNILNKGYFTNRVKLLAAYKEDKAIQSYFDLTKSDDKIFEMIKLNELTEVEMVGSAKKALNIDIGKILSANFISSTAEKCGGNALRFE